MLAPTDLLGTWAMDRTIDDRRLADTSTVTGTLTLTRDGEELAWSEVGEWSCRGRVLPVWRTLRLVRRDAGWWVLFADGREFHPWAPGAEVEHPCGRDTYRGLVDGDAEAWTITWDVAGPEKDYTMRSRLSGRTRPASA